MLLRAGPLVPARYLTRATSSLPPLFHGLRLPPRAPAQQQWRALSSSSGEGSRSGGEERARSVSSPPSPSPPSPSPPSPLPPVVPFSSSPLGWWRANTARAKAMMSQYGYLAVATYFGVYLVTLGSLYGLVTAGVIAAPTGGVDEFINSWSVKKALLGEEPLHISPGFTGFATAWLLTKTTEPLRLVVTIGAVPAIARWAPASVLRMLRVRAPTGAGAAPTATGVGAASGPRAPPSA